MTPASMAVDVGGSLAIGAAGKAGLFGKSGEHFTKEQPVNIKIVTNEGRTVMEESVEQQDKEQEVNSQLTNSLNAARPAL